uniref:Uncharacterized protein n=1 Tax=Anguilla anguilla TaxID=7936 RepID=A0A0E9X7A2_ANGAN
MSCGPKPCLYKRGSFQTFGNGWDSCWQCLDFRNPKNGSTSRIFNPIKPKPFKKKRNKINIPSIC